MFVRAVPGALIQIPVQQPGPTAAELAILGAPGVIFGLSDWLSAIARGLAARRSATQRVLSVACGTMYA
jgi:hypothetical protein